MCQMIKAKQQVIDKWNQTADSAWYGGYRTEEAIAALMANPPCAFLPQAFSPY